MAKYSNSGSLTYQVKRRFRDIDAIGQKKATDPKNEYIHSIGTMKTYTNHCIKFANYCKERYNIKVLEDCKPYIKEFIEQGDYSSWVKKTQRSAIAKLYGVSSKELGEIDTGQRSRDTVKRSRKPAKRDKHFNPNGKYRDYVKFCKATGLRKIEITSLKGNSFKINDDGVPVLEVTRNTKGGRHREVPILKEYVSFVKDICLKAGSENVLPVIAHGRNKVPDGADTHSYRAWYANTLYKRLERPLYKLTTEEKYFCRNELKGVIYDKGAMGIVSKALGHTRLSIIAISYLREDNNIN